MGYSLRVDARDHLKSRNGKRRLLLNLLECDHKSFQDTVGIEDVDLSDHKGL